MFEQGINGCGANGLVSASRSTTSYGAFTGDLREISRFSKSPPTVPDGRGTFAHTMAMGGRGGGGRVARGPPPPAAARGGALMRRQRRDESEECEDRFAGNLERADSICLASNGLMDSASDDDNEKEMSIGMVTMTQASPPNASAIMSQMPQKNVGVLPVRFSSVLALCLAL